MQPRLKSSSKWTNVPKDFIQQIQTVFRDSFAGELKGAQVVAEGRIYPEEILMSLGVKSPNQLKHSHFEVSIAYKKDKDNVLKLMHLAVDALASLFEHLWTLESDQELPRQWEELDFEGQKLFFQYSTINKDLESEANRLLGIKDGEELVGGEWTSDDAAEDAESIKARLGVSDLDEDDEEGEEPPSKKKH